MKKLIVTTVFSVIFLGHIFCKEPTIALHVYNPLGLIQKVGGKVEYRANRMGFLFGAIRYYGSIPSYPGTQFGLEWRKYSIPQPTKKAVNFFYTKLIAGHQEHLEAQGSGFLSVSEIPEGNYYGAGAGVGRHINFNHFFIDINAGLKYVASTVKQETAFYITGPASYLDLHFNFGFQF